MRLLKLVVPVLRRTWGRALAMAVQFAVGAAVISVVAALIYQEGALMNRLSSQIQVGGRVGFATEDVKTAVPKGVASVTLIRSSWRRGEPGNRSAESDAHVSQDRAPWEVEIAIVNPEYPRWFRPAIAAGRWLDAADWTDSYPVPVVANAAAANLIAPGGSPLGKRVGLKEQFVVVGVLAPGEPLLVVSGYALGDMAMAGEPLMVAPGTALGTQPDLSEELAQGALWVGLDLDQQDNLTSTWLLEEASTRTHNIYRTNGIALYAVAGLVLSLACIGLAGVLLSSLEQRWVEFGLRTALGATPALLMTQLWLEMLSTVLAGGLLGGLAGAWLAIRVPGGPPRFLPHIPLLVLLAMLTLGTLVILVPLYQVRKRSIDSILRNEGSG